MPETPDWSAPVAIRVSNRNNQPITASEVGQTVAGAIGILGTQVVVVSFTFAADVTAGSAGVLRDWVEAFLSDNVSGAVLGRCGISPEKPADTVSFPYGQVIGSGGAGVQVTATTRVGSGSQQCVFDLAYYQVGTPSL